MSIYDLPDLRPFRTIAHRLRLAGGAVVTENGVLQSDDYVTGVSGWAVFGNGDVEFNSGVFRGDIAAASFRVVATLLDTSDFEVDTESWVADNGNTTVTRSTSTPISGTASLLLDVSPGNTAAARHPGIAVTPGLIYYVEAATDADPDDVSEQSFVELRFLDAGASPVASTWEASGRGPGGGPYVIALYAEAPPTAATVQIVVGSNATSWDLRFDDVTLYEGGSLTGALVDTRPFDGAPGVRLDTSVQIFDEARLPGGPALLEPGAKEATLPQPWAGNGLILRDQAGNYLYMLDTGSSRAVALVSDDVHLHTVRLMLGDYRPDLDVLGDWEDYTPTDTNITVGDGTRTAAFMLIGHTCFVRWHLTLGSTSAIGTSASIGLPFAARTGVPQQSLHGGGFDASAVFDYVFTARIATAATVAVVLQTLGGAAAGRLANNAPFTWAQDDELWLTGCYEIEP